MHDFLWGRWRGIYLNYIHKFRPTSSSTSSQRSTSKSIFNVIPWGSTATQCLHSECLDRDSPFNVLFSDQQPPSKLTLQVIRLNIESCFRTCHSQEFRCSRILLTTWRLCVLAICRWISMNSLKVLERLLRKLKEFDIHIKTLDSDEGKLSTYTNPYHLGPQHFFLLICDAFVNSVQELRRSLSLRLINLCCFVVLDFCKAELIYIWQIWFLRSIWLLC